MANRPAVPAVGTMPERRYWA